MRLNSNDTVFFFSFLFFPGLENLEGLQQVVQERLAELLRVLKAVIGKHQTLNSVDILGAAGTVIAKVKGQYLARQHAWVHADMRVNTHGRPDDAQMSWHEISRHRFRLQGPRQSVKAGWENTSHWGIFFFIDFCSVRGVFVKKFTV